MEQKFGKNSIDIEALREFCEREGKEVTYRKGDQLEREGDPARWFGSGARGRPRTVVRLRHRRVLQVRDTRHQRRQGAHHMVLVRGRVCDRLSQLSRRSSIADYYRGDDAQPRAPCER